MTSTETDWVTPKVHLPVREPSILDRYNNNLTIRSGSTFDITQRHPCFGGAIAHSQHGRIHLPVAPRCNIHCRFCTRGFDSTSLRPGVAGRLLKTTEVVPAVRRALEFCPEISVVGVAGPGDALASTHALEALELVHQAFPNLLKCLSTNGLALPALAERVWKAGVRSITVTINAVDPERLLMLCDHVIWEGKVLKGLDAAKRLITAQLEGIRAISQLGAVVKVNTVLVPGINTDHIDDIVEAAATAGAHVANIIPLIPNGSLATLKAPSADEVELARGVAERRLAVYRTCRQCRADACGIPGSGVDFARQVFGDDITDGTWFSHG